MKILGVIGLGLGILILQALVPELFSTGETTVITGFETATSAFQKAQVMLNSLPQ